MIILSFNLMRVHLSRSRSIIVRQRSLFLQRPPFSCPCSVMDDKGAVNEDFVDNLHSRFIVSILLSKSHATQNANVSGILSVACGHRCEKSVIIWFFVEAIFVRGKQMAVLSVGHSSRKLYWLIASSCIEFHSSQDLEQRLPLLTPASTPFCRKFTKLNR